MTAVDADRWKGSRWPNPALACAAVKAISEDDHRTDDQTADASSLRMTMATRRRSLPWSDRSILLVSALIVLLVTPLWLDPVTLGEFLGIERTAAACSSSATPEPGLNSPAAATPAPAPTAAPTTCDGR